MPLFSELVDKVAADEAYLESTLAQAAQHDEFTARLLGVLRGSRGARARFRAGEVVLGVHRSDYMLDAPSGGFLQVGGLSAGPTRIVQAVCRAWGLRQTAGAGSRHLRGAVSSQSRGRVVVCCKAGEVALGVHRSD